MKPLQLICCLIVFLLSGIAYSQQKDVEFTKENFPNDKEDLKAANKAIKEGDRLYNIADVMYKQAIDPYLEAYKFNPNNADLNYKLGKCYLNSSYKTKSLTFLEKAYAINKDISPDIYYLLGKAYQLNLEFDEAVAFYKKFKEILKPGELRELGADIDKRILECNNGIKLIGKPVNVKIESIGSTINSEFPEYGPLITADESQLFFTSRRNTTTGGQKDIIMNDYFEDIYYCEKKNDVWSEIKNIGKPINDNKHNATAGMSLDGQILYVYIDQNNGDIYETNLKGTEWLEPVKLSGDVNTKHHESTASLSFDGKSLFIVSDRPGGIGGRDIYRVTKNKKGEWDKAENLGNVVNTAYDEEGVFAHPDGKTVYFSSKGHNSIGGFDIYRTTFENGKWTQPVSIGYPINTVDDDVFFVMAASGKHGYYASVKSDTKGDKDIYIVTFLEDKKDSIISKTDSTTIKVQPVQAILLKGVITDSQTGLPIESSIEIIDNQKNEVIANLNSNAATGKYLLSLPAGKNYAIVVKSEGYLFHSENFDIVATKSFTEIEKNVALSKLQTGSKIVLNNIFFDTDKSDLKSESTNELERLISLMKEYPKMKIQISGHTDNVGSAAHNQPLSEARAKSVVDYLVKNGIDKSRMVFKGFGFSQPIADNTTEQGKAMNRRTEFLIIEK